LFVAHVAEAGLAQQVLHTGIAQLGDLVTHSRRRVVERPGGKHLFDRLVLADHGIGPGAQHRRVDGETRRIDPEKIAAALELVKAGLSPTVAARQLGLGRSTVYREIGRAGIAR
jgi:transcriptional regulator of acetoin/glycerol metabolism